MKKIQFYLRFRTQFGQSLHISGNIDALGNHDQAKAFPLQYLNSEFWHGTLEADAASAARIQYNYLLRDTDGSILEEWGNDRIIDISGEGIDEFQVIDTWNHSGEFENAFYTAPFRQVLLKNHPANKVKYGKKFTHIFKVKAPLLKKNEVLCISGSGINLGEWNTDEPVLMTRDSNWWVAKVNLPKESFPLNYKYGTYDARHKKFGKFEGGPNRILYGDAQKKKLTILHDGFATLPNHTWKGAGVAIPVFSLRSKTSFGTGEFTDLKLLVDWARQTGFHLIQLLPVNDTMGTNSWLDSYPYSAISAFALHPLYLNLEKVAGKKYASLVKPLKKKQKQLNELPELDYEQVIEFKLSVIKELFLAQKDEFLADEDFQAFFKQQKHWLVPFAAFCYLKDRNKTADFSRWKLYGKYDKAAIEKYVSPRAKHYDNIATIYFIQYHLHLQLREAVEYAHKNGVVLKGDIPIGISRHSCDAWVEPELYHMDEQAGAPPDDFAVKGQNWGFPTYNWERMAEDGFAWWRKRFEQMREYFDAFRIDHVLGFFRIWAIPMHAVEGIMGHFEPAIPVHISEFHSRGISFDHHRYTQPYINDAVLWEMFGPNKDKFKKFLEAGEDGSYTLRDEYSTQRQVEAYFTGLEEDEENKNIRQGLFDLVSNVILFEVAGSGGLQFHFRIAMENTISFRHLDGNTQHQLKELYVNYFYHRQDDFWQKEAMKKLPALKRSTNMLVCGEDLGMVPHCVPEVMKQLGILSLEIQRMPKHSHKSFSAPADAPYLSVVTPSTHDMSTIRGWWEEDRAKTQQFFNQELGQWGEAPAFCEAWINKAIVLQHLQSPAMWSIFQLQDLLGMNESLRRDNPQEERINIPANSKHYWRYRMHIYLEDLLKAKAFNEELKEYAGISGRGTFK
ncbi:MAG TPA: 4-alpha-glucanotransferase [Chitinophagaceae bacterium]|nr:4-alpha-glucanotransferase [Chitinophagaceae bacterium]